MACFHPVDAWQLESGEIVFCERGKIRRSVTFACGQCVGCRLERSRQWAVRIMHESSMFDRSSFVTLTYDDVHLPSDGGLHYRDFQLFMKRLRKVCGPTRFFMCGEYGERLKRPHFHACLFGCWFADGYQYSISPAGFPIYRSITLENLWPSGFSSFGAVTFDSAAYVARYCLKKVTGRNARDHYFRVDGETGEFFHVSPEFANMSLKPGIGANWFAKYRKDVFERDYVVINGVKCKPPRYYDNLLAAQDSESSEYMAFARAQKVTAKLIADSTSARLKVREDVVKSRLNFKSRSLE